MKKNIIIAFAHSMSPMPFLGAPYMYCNMLV